MSDVSGLIREIVESLPEEERGHWGYKDCKAYALKENSLVAAARCDDHDDEKGVARAAFISLIDPVALLALADLLDVLRDRELEFSDAYKALENAILRKD